MSQQLQDILTPALYANGIPHDLLRELRRKHGVVWIDEPATDSFEGGKGYWLFLRHADVSHISRHPQDFSSWQGTSFLRDQRPSDVAVLRRMMLNMDPPEHGSVRRIVNRAFTPQAIRKQLFDSITSHAREVVDNVCELGSTDFLSNVAAEMPLLVLADVLGVPPQDRKLLYSWTNRLVGIDDPEYGADPADFLSAFTEMFGYARVATQQRRENPTDDLWSTIVNAEVDGDRLSDGELDRFFQLLCIAGNDTTRNLLANTMLTLSQHPDQFDMLRNDLSLLPGAIEEVLRFSPSVIQFRRTTTRDMEYRGVKIAEGDKVIINYASANRDELVFEDPDRFDITRDPNPHISFGDGTHFCLGANLARLEVKTLLTELFNRLPDIDVDGEASHLQSSFMNGIKYLPVRFTSTAKRGPVAPASTAEPSVTAESGPTDEAVASHGIPMLVLYGSNFGTAEDVANEVAETAERRGFSARTAPLDDAVDALPTDGVVVVATATYNGTPPDNAVKFSEWITQDGADLAGVRYAVFGCGNREWAPTFQDFPRLVDQRLEQLGATRVHLRGEGDAADDFDGALHDWDSGLWPALAEVLGLDFTQETIASAPRLRVEFLSEDRPSPFVESLAARPMRVLSSQVLTNHDGPVDARPVRHIELELPWGTTYGAGDHMGVIPHNSPELVERVTRRFGISPDGRIRIELDGHSSSFLPVGERVTVRQVLTDYVELQSVAGRRDIERLIEHTEYPGSRKELSALLDKNHYRQQVLERRLSVLDLLEKHPTVRLSFADYLELLSPLAPRYYSISSSPKVQPDACTITVGALVDEARSGNGTFRGTCSNYLFDQNVDRTVHAFVRDTSTSFRLPEDPKTPVLMVASGTGIAPFRGFLQERSALSAEGSSLGPGLLVFGCRHPQADELYADELPSLLERGHVEFAAAYSRVPGLPRVYVQDRIRQLSVSVLALIDRGAVIYICGAAAMAEGVKQALIEIKAAQSGQSAESAELWLQELASDQRWLVDVWANG